MTTKKEYMIGYLKDVLEYLDGNGLVLTDDDLIEEALQDRIDYEHIAGKIAECDSESDGFVLEALPRTVVYTLQEDDIDPNDLIEDTYLEEDDE